MIFQEPMTSLNPCFTVGFQIMETLRVHEGGSRAERRRRTIELLDQVGIPEPALAPRCLPAPALRRHEPARHDRHGDRLQPAPADRRRADHRARRHHPGADPRSSAAAAARPRHGAGPDHPRHGRGRRDRRAHRGDVCRRGRGGAAGARICSSSRIIPIPRPCWRRCRSAASGTGASARFPASCPGVDDRPAGCLFNPRCSYADDHCRRIRPEITLEAPLEEVRCLKPLNRRARAARAREAAS